MSLPSGGREDPPSTCDVFGPGCSTVVSDHIFPVPLLPVEPVDKSLSRVVRQRHARLRQVLVQSNETLRSLNWMAVRGEPDPAAPPSRVQIEAQDLVMQRVSERAPGSCAPNVEEAVRALLHVAAGYSEACVNVATFKEGQVSLPDSVKDAP